MAKTKGLQATEFENFDDGLDDFKFDDFDFEVRDQPDDRHPVIKALSPVGGAMKSFATNQNNVEKFVKASLPRGYGQVHELGTETVSELKALYNSAKEELKPVGNVAKTFIGKALPSVGDKLPKGLREKLEQFSKKEESWQSSREQNQEERLASLLGEVFQNQQQTRAQDQAAYVEKENLRQGFEQVRHRDSMGQLNAIRESIESLSQYTTGPNFNFQKKSLEISYRSFWALTELVKEQKEANAKVLSELKATSKNTGLPDFLKITTTESARQLLRNKFLENARERMFGGAKTYIQRFSRNLRDQASRTLSSIGGVASSIDSASGMLDGAGLPKSERDKMLVSGLMDIPLNWASEKGSAWLRKRTSKNRTIRRGDAQLRNFADSAGERINNALTDPNNDWGVFEGLREILRNTAPNGSVDTKIEGDIIGRQHEAIPWQRQSAKTLNEIIPGLLARIHQELRIIRTGDEKADLITYDFTKNRFTTQGAMGTQLKANLSGRHAERFQKGVGELASIVDRGGKLTPQQRALLERKIAERAMNDSSLDVSRVTSSYDWGGGEDGQAIASVFARYLRSENGKLGKTGAAAERQLNLSKRFRDLTAGMTDPRAEMQMLANAGQLEMLRASGLIGANDDSLSRETLVNILMGTDPDLMAANRAGATPSAGANGALSRFARAKKANRRPEQTVQRQGLAGAAGGPEMYRHGEQMLSELKAIKEQLLNKSAANPSTTIDDSETGKAVKNIERLIEQLNELTAHSQGVQINLVTGIANQMGVPSDLNNFEMATRGLSGMASSVFNKAVNTGKGIFNNVLRPISDRVTGAVGRAFDITKSTSISAFNRVTGVLGDVYAAGEWRPRLRKSVMEAGGYLDAKTKKVIKSLNDVKGDILDSAGNVVMTYEEFKNGYVGGKYKKPVQALLKGALGQLQNMANFTQNLVGNIVPNAIKSAGQAAMSAFESAKKMLPPYDVYLKGELDKPLLYANLMRYNEYFSEKTGKPITHPRDIDGPIKDRKGNYVVTIEHLQTGLVDAQGRGLRLRFLGKLMAAGSNLVRSAVSKLRATGEAALGFIGQTMSKFGGFFKDLFGPLARFERQSQKTNVWLEKIHDLLDLRLPGRKKVIGDLDGDGIREGSIADMLRKRKQEKEEKSKTAEKGEDKKSTSMLSRLMAGVTGLFSSKKGKDDEEDDEDDDDGFGLSDVADAADIYDAANGDGNGRDDSKKGRRRSRKGRRRLKRMGRRAPKMPTTTAAGKQGVGRAAANVAKRGVFSTAIPSFLGRMLGGTATVARAGIGLLGAGASGLAGAAPVVAKAAGSLISLPVALAVGAAVGGYMIYRYSQKTKATELSRLRLVQYGIKPDDPDSAKKLWELESLLEKALVVDGERIGIDNKKFDREEAAKIMQLTPGDAQIFNEYFRARFTPVFVHWIKVLRRYDPSGKIAKIEDIVPPKDKWTVAQTAVSGLSQVYAWTTGWSTNFSRLPSGSTEVNNYLETIRIALLRQSEKAGGEKATALEKTATATTLGSAVQQATAAMKDQQQYKVTDKQGKQLDVNQMTHAELTEKLRTGEAFVQVQLNVPKVLLHNTSLNQVDALTSVRMKAYGLKEMTLSKVQQLGALEVYMEDHMSAATDSPTAGIKPEQVMRDVAEVFGIADSDERHKNRFRYWFNGRFLPVFLMYAGAVRKRSKKKNLREGVKLLPLGEQLVLARAIVAARGVGAAGGMISVWHNPSNPWKEEYELNNNADSTASNIEAIRLLSDKVALGEEAARASDTSNQDQTKAAFGRYKQPLRRKTEDKGYGSNMSGIQASGDKLVGDALNASGTGTKAGTALNLSAGGKALQFGSVKAGVYSSLPDMVGSGWQAAKALVVAAAKATGVDVEALASLIAQESGFDPNATPKGFPSPSSAKGLGQHLPSSWAEDMQMHARELGIPQGASPFDPKASVLLTAMRLRRNAMQLEKVLGRKVTGAETYLAHLMGAGGAQSLLKLGANEVAMNSSSGGAAKRQHPEYFVDPRSGKARTVAETVRYVSEKLQRKLSEFQISPVDFSGAQMTADQNPAMQSAMTAQVPTDSGQQELVNKTNGVLPARSPVAVRAHQQAAASGAVAGGSYSASATNLYTPQRDSGTFKANLQPTNPMPTQPGGVTLNLDRENSEDDGTYGVLRLPDGTSFMTLELPWKDNARQTSCIPPGSYKARRRQTTKFGFAFEVLNVPNRTGILIHGGTYAGSKDLGQKANSEGCILLGMGRGHSGRQKIITGFKEAMEAFYNRLGNHTEFTLVIKGPDNAMGSIASSKTVDLQPMRETATQPSTAPSLPKPTALPAAPSSSPSSGAAPAAPTPLPRLSQPTRAIDPRVEPGPADMRARDEALTKVIAPKVDGIQTTLTDQLVELRRIVELLAKPQADPAVSSSPTTAPQGRQNVSPAAPISQRRNL